MSALDNLILKFQQMSRVMQFATLSIVFAALYLGWDAYIKPIGDNWDRRAEAIANQVNQIQAAELTARDLRRNQQLVTGIGPVQPPLPQDVGATLFNNEVNAILTKHSASNTSFSARGRSNLPRGTLNELAPGKRIEKHTADVKFDASPSAAIAIIADLESSPLTGMINNLRIVKDATNKVKVQLTIEGWLLTNETVNLRASA